MSRLVKISDLCNSKKPQNLNIFFSLWAILYLHNMQINMLKAWVILSELNCKSSAVVLLSAPAGAVFSTAAVFTAATHREHPDTTLRHCCPSRWWQSSGRGLSRTVWLLGSWAWCRGGSRGSRAKCVTFGTHLDAARHWEMSTWQLCCCQRVIWHEFRFIRAMQLVTGTNKTVLLTLHRPWSWGVGSNCV